jgi:hypothetical protein
MIYEVEISELAGAYYFVLGPKKFPSYLEGKLIAIDEKGIMVEAEGLMMFKITSPFYEAQITETYLQSTYKIFLPKNHPFRNLEIGTFYELFANGRHTKSRLYNS